MARFLLCHAPFGSGHTVAMEAIKEAIREKDSDAEIVSIDVFSYLPKWAEKAIIKSYLWILAHCPSLYRHAYRLGDRRRGSMLLMRLIAPLMRSRLLRDVRACRPDVIVCTHATPTMLASELAQRGCFDIPIVAVVTDYVVHRMWMHSGVTRYFVAHEGLAARLASCGLSETAVTVSGIPVRAQFRPKQAVRERGRILVMGGGMGLVSLEPILRAVSHIKTLVRLHIITGSEIGRQRTLEITKHYPYEIIVDGYSPCVGDAMRRASVLITKAGGVSIAEAMAIGIPLILFGSLAGQEERNTEFLMQRGAATAARDEEELYQQLEKILLRCDAAVEKMMAVQADLKRPLAAQTIAETVQMMIERE